MSFVIEKGVLEKYTGRASKVVIPEGVTVIGQAVFADNWSIDTVVIPEGVVRIEDVAFMNVHLKEIKFPSTLKEIGAHAFLGCHIEDDTTTLIIPEGVTEIGASAFVNCDWIEKLVLPESLQSIGMSAFKGCTRLRLADTPLPECARKVILSVFDPEFLEGIPVDADGFAIQDGILLRYRGTAVSVTIPESVREIGAGAFFGCKDITSLTVPSHISCIPDMMCRDCKRLKTVHLSAGIEKIGNYAFDGCSDLTDLTLPDGIKEIGKSAFYGCCSLREIHFGAGLERIGESAFQSCGALESVSLPVGMKFIDVDAFAVCEKLSRFSISECPETVKRKAFCLCRSFPLNDFPFNRDTAMRRYEIFYNAYAWLEDNLPCDENGLCVLADVLVKWRGDSGTLTIPEKIRVISVGALPYHNSKLRTLILPTSLERIERDTLSNFNNLRVCFAGVDGLKTTQKLSPDTAKYVPIESAEDAAYVLIYQTNKLWMEQALRAPYDANDVLAHCRTLLAPMAKIAPASAKQVIAFMAEKEASLAPQNIADTLTLMEKKKCKIDRSLFKSIASLSSGAPAVHPIDAFADEYIKTHPLKEKAVAAVKASTKVRYTSGELASLNALRLLLSECILEEYWKDFRLSETAKKIAEALDREGLLALLRSLNKSTKLSDFCHAYVTFATESEMEALLARIEENKQGSKQARDWAQRMSSVIVYSSTHAALLYCDRENMLDRYAYIHKISQLELKDYRLPALVTLDTDGVKRYDVGGTTIEVSIGTDLSFTLFDTAKNKFIRSFPKKTADPAKAAECAEDFKTFKKNILDYFKLRTRLIHELHLTGYALSEAFWNEMCLKHPLLKRLVALLIWQDETGKSFMPTENGIIDAQGNPYAPKGQITLAHVISLTAEEISAWQTYLTKHSLVQPFAQMWEPIIEWKADDPAFRQRYQGVVISKTERNALKKDLAAWGIEMRSKPMARELVWTQRGYQPMFSNRSTFEFDECLELNYEVDPDSGDTTLQSIPVCVDAEENRRYLNVILFHLDRAAIRSRIASGDDQSVVKSLALGFTAAQINEFIALSAECGQTACTAVLLEYKNEHFPAFEDMDEFSLDW